MHVDIVWYAYVSDWHLAFMQRTPHFKEGLPVQQHSCTTAELPASHVWQTCLCSRHGPYRTQRASLDDLRISLSDGAFNLRQYIELQPRRTEWLAGRYRRMLELTQQMADKEHPERTMKSYLLQAYEAISREEKVGWAERGGHTWLNLQHDGVIIALAPGTTEVQAARELSEACSKAVGYLQPVEVKQMCDGTTPAHPTAPGHRGACGRSLRWRRGGCHRRDQRDTQLSAPAQGAHSLLIGQIGTQCAEPARTATACNARTARMRSPRRTADAGKLTCAAWDMLAAAHRGLVYTQHLPCLPAIAPSLPRLSSTR